MTLSGNYNHVCLGTAALAQLSHIHSAGQVTCPGCPSSRDMAMVDLSSLFPTPQVTISPFWWLGFASISFS